MNTPNIETKTFISGTAASTMTDAQIFARIAKLEESIETLNKIKAKPKKLVALVNQTQADIDKLVEYVDSRS